MSNPDFAKGMHRTTPSPQTGEYPSSARAIPKPPITLSPPTRVAHEVMAAFAKCGRHVSAECRESVANMFNRGAYRAALDLLRREHSRNGESTGAELQHSLRAIAISALEERLGDLWQVVTPSAGDSAFDVAFARVLALAADKPSLHTLIDRTRLDRLHALELLANLVRHHWLTLAPARLGQYTR